MPDIIERDLKASAARGAAVRVWEPKIGEKVSNALENRNFRIGRCTPLSGRASSVGNTGEGRFRIIVEQLFCIL